MAIEPPTTTLHLPDWTPDKATVTTPPATVQRTALKDAPSIRNIYWCLFHDAALPPEFSKRRPVVVFSHRNTLTGPISVLPITKYPQPDNPWSIKLATNPIPGEVCDAWVVCNHLTAVSCLRLTQRHGKVPRLTPDEFRPIHELVLQWLPPLLPIEYQNIVLDDVALTAHVNGPAPNG